MSADVKLSLTMERNLRRLRDAEKRNTQAHLPTSQAMALERRGLVTTREAQRASYIYGGMPCDLTTKGRRIAREL